jgi:hypothetical protein
MFSYNNAGFCVLGRIVEVLRGKPFDECLRERLFAPLGLTHAAPGPYEAILYRVAVGHLQPGPDDEPRPAPMWALARSNGPAGAMLAMRPRDLLGFAQLHLSGGKAPDGGAVLGTGTVEAMRQPQVKLPPLGMMGDAWGLGWELYDMAGRAVIGHDGGTIGQAAFLRMVPDRDVAVTLLTNGGDVIGLYTALLGHLLRELAGVELPALPRPVAEPEPVGAEEAARYAGSYASDVAELTVSRDGDGRLWLEQVPKGLLADIGGQVERYELVRLTGSTFVPAQARRGVHTPHAFVGDDGTGRALYLHSGRATRRAT